MRYATTLRALMVVALPVALNSRVQALSKPTPALDTAFVAVITKAIGNSKHGVQVDYDRGRFRLGFVRPALRKKPPVRFNLYDGKPPHLLWEYASDKRQAWIDLGTYDPSEKRRQRPLNWVFTRYDLGADAWKKVGTSKVAGIACEVWEGTTAPSATVPSHLGTRRQKAWIDSGSGLVLKLERGFHAQPGSKTRAMKETLLVERIRFVDRLPSERFTLPKGTVAALQDGLSHLQLPNGVKRVPLRVSAAPARPVRR